MRYAKSRGRRHWLRTSLALLVAGLAAGLLASTVGGATSQATPIKLGFISPCKGPVATTYELSLAGGMLAALNFGAKPAGVLPSQGVGGLKIAGRPVEVIVGCSDATPDGAVAEARRLVEQQNVNIIVGPLSGAEGPAVASYAKASAPKVIFAMMAGSQAIALQVRAPNVFKFSFDGAQLAAGLGEYAYKTLGWRKAVVIGDDYDFPWAVAAGFVVEFCALGGEIEKRIWPPLGTTDYSSYIAQIPRTGIDGILMGIAGGGPIAFLKQYELVFPGTIPKKMVFGPAGIPPEIVAQIGQIAVGAVSSYPIAIDSANPATKKFVAEMTARYGHVTGSLGFLPGAYYHSTWAILQSLKNVKGDFTKLRAELLKLGKAGFNGPMGFMRLDANREAIAPGYLIKLVGVLAGKAIYKTIRTIPNIEQSYGGVFKAGGQLASRDYPPCVKRTPPPWVGKWKAGPPKA